MPRNSFMRLFIRRKPTTLLGSYFFTLIQCVNLAGLSYHNTSIQKRNDRWGDRGVQWVWSMWTTENDCCCVHWKMPNNLEQRKLNWQPKPSHKGVMEFLLKMNNPTWGHEPFQNITFMAATPLFFPLYLPPETPPFTPTLLFASLYLLSSCSCARLHLCCLIHPPRPSLPLHFIASLDSTSSRCWGWERWKNMVRKKEGERGRGNRAKGIRKTEWEQIEINRSSGEAYDESLEEYGEERKWKKRRGMVRLR